MPPSSILVVEDEPTLRRLLEYRLSRSYRVRVATNGVEALALIDAELPHLIVSDIMMPQMDGFALHAALQERPNTRVLPFIFLTAKADEQSRMRGLRTGVDDYITKPFDIEQLLERISRLLERTRVYQTQLSGEIGQDFSQRLMPRSLPEIPGYRFAFHNSPRDQGGGDFFDWAETHPGVFFFTVGDVMGKGLKAKFYAFSFLSYVRGTLYSMVEQTSSPAALMQQLNRRLMQDAVMEDTFASLLLVRFDAAAHRVTLCNAGHCRPLRRRRRRQRPRARPHPGCRVRRHDDRGGARRRALRLHRRPPRTAPHERRDGRRGGPHQCRRARAPEPPPPRRPHARPPRPLRRPRVCRRRPRLLAPARRLSRVGRGLVSGWVLDGPRACRTPKGTAKRRVARGLRATERDVQRKTFSACR